MYKELGTHKDLVNYQYEVLGLKCNPHFYQRQSGVALRLCNEFGREDILLVMKYFHETGLPKDYKSIYFLDKYAKIFIPKAKEYYENKCEIKDKEIINVKHKQEYISKTKF